MVEKLRDIILESIPEVKEKLATAYGQLRIGEDPGAPPAGREHEAHQQKRERVDPELPEREDPRRRDQTGDEQGRIGGELRRRHRRIWRCGVEHVSEGFPYSWKNLSF